MPVKSAYAGGKAKMAKKSRMDDAYMGSVAKGMNRRQSWGDGSD